MMTTETAKHTPGPWTTSKLDPLQIVVEPNRARGESCYIVIAEGPKAYQPAHLIYSTAKANARLLAAAPELLEALEDFIDSLTPYSPKQIDFARDTIAKAKGTEPPLHTQLKGDDPS